MVITETLSPGKVHICRWCSSLCHRKTLKSCLFHAVTTFYPPMQVTVLPSIVEASALWSACSPWYEVSSSGNGPHHWLWGLSWRSLIDDWWSVVHRHSNHNNCIKCGKGGSDGFIIIHFLIQDRLWRCTPVFRIDHLEQIYNSLLIVWVVACCCWLYLLTLFSDCNVASRIQRYLRHNAFNNRLESVRK